MKHITLIIGLLVVGCGKQEQADTNESTPTTNTNKVDGATAKPVKGLTLEEEKVVGTYELKSAENTFKLVLLANGVCEHHTNGKNTYESKWRIADGEIYITTPNPLPGKDGFPIVCSINKDGSITLIAGIVDGKRTESPKEKQMTFKKIK